MRPKLKLNLDELSIDSFDTTRPAQKQGTVFGEQCTHLIGTVAPIPGSSRLRRFAHSRAGIPSHPPEDTMQGKIKLNVEELAIESFGTNQVAVASNTAYTDCYVYTNCLGSCNLSCHPTECGACTYTCNYAC